MKIDMGYMAAAFIAICCIFDIRKKEIPIFIIVAFGILSLIAVAIAQKPELYSVLYSLIPGAAMLGLSLCTKESIGYGDGFVVLVLGVLLGFVECVFVVLAGLFLSAVVGLVLLVFKKVRGKSRMPFMPFLAAGLGVVFFV
ncbi:prepilin peptidase [Kineothrix sedimenti]|uniref:Prepilin peptidase n=1 Tax=Kineothrix sedimenti TaxID=3123317 RepID=A0ABZ3EY72_9FIRM